MIKVWADTHFNHTGILKYTSRPYFNVWQMNEALIALWNGAVSEKDEMWLLGDFAFYGAGSTPPEQIFERLNGHKHLVIGNHDEKNPKVLALKWESKEKLVTLKENGIRAEACHYPLATWKKSAHGALMLHGHCHGNLREQIPHRFDVGVDVFQQPVSLVKLAEIASKQEFKVVDHHGEKKG